ncbi:MAG: nucleotidyltransferase family protein [Bacteroidales bacterium]|nr:nucleotidyltransferase family protein [Bacteroidales bacterium]
MKAMILAAGKGTRLGKITDTMPKVLLDINGKSMLQRAVEKCTLAGFDDIIINVHHFADMVEEHINHLRKDGLRISVSDERDKLLETAGGLFKARKFFDNDPFLLYNADIISDIDLTKLYQFHIEKRGLATLAVRNRPGVRYLLIDSQGLMRGWYNKDTGERIITGETVEGLSEIAFSGIHIIDPEIFKYMTEGIYTMTSLYLKLSSAHDIYTFRDDTGYWANAGTPEILDEVRKVLASRAVSG